MKRKITLLFIAAAIVLAAILHYPLRSYAVMKIYSATEESNSVMAKNNYKIKMGTDNMWYPFVITFNSRAFGANSGTGADMSIMYNFGKFQGLKSSLMYDETSSYYSAFYGAYALSNDGEIYGFDGSDVLVDDLIKAFKYDYTTLVLKSVGCANPTFTAGEYEINEDITYIGIEGWTRIDAAISTNSMGHNYNSFHQAYIQYGRPSAHQGEDFEIIETNGRLYAKYFPEYNSTIVIYVMAIDMNVINECDASILSKTMIVDR